MSQITFAQLESSRSVRGYVDFEATVKVKFESHEVNHLWEIAMQMVEDDGLRKDDDLGRPVKRNFTATDEEMTVKIAHRLRTGDVSTELGDEEVYGEITIRPLNPPPAFITSTAKTGVEVVAV
jgi:hypothetical protein